MSHETERAERNATIRCPFCSKLNRVNLARVDDRPRCGECDRPLLLDRPLKLTDEDFDRVIGDSDVPVLVDFHADWCGPCKTMAPTLDAIARDRMGRLLVAKLDTDLNPDASRRYGIRGIPTLILFRDGEEVERVTGAVPRESLDALLDSAA